MDFEYEERFRRLGLKVAFYRKLKGMTQAELAEAMQTNVSFIGAIEATNMHKPISLRTVFKLADILEVHPAKLLDD